MGILEYHEFVSTYHGLAGPCLPLLVMSVSAVPLAFSAVFLFVSTDVLQYWWGLLTRAVDHYRLLDYDPTSQIQINDCQIKPCFLFIFYYTTYE